VHRRPVFGTSIELTELSFGAASLGNLYRETTDEEARAAVDQAWTSEIRYFDTAPHYGLGLSERRLGEALAAYPREDFVLSTKVGRLLVENENPTEHDSDMFVVPGNLRREWDFSRDGVLRSVEDSLARTGVDYFDILYLHDPDVSGIEDAAKTGAQALIELRDQGLVRAVGIGSNSASAVAALFRESDIDLAMLAGRYTLLERNGADEVFEAAGDRSIVAVGVFNSGLLSTHRPEKDAKYNYEQAPDELIAQADALADVAERWGVTVPGVALHFPLVNPQVASVAIGMRTAAQVVDNVRLWEATVPEALWQALD
jgi:D-threo-aldose 1-dehydrogenase